jgi:hypothetical protein
VLGGGGRGAARAPYPGAPGSAENQISRRGSRRLRSDPPPIPGRASPDIIGSTDILANGTVHARNPCLEVILSRHLAAAALLALVACAHKPLATETSAAAIRGAEEAGASGVPTAALHLQLARESEDEARALAADGKKEEAVSLLLRAEADAELAAVLARADAARAATEAANAELAALRAAPLAP